MKVSASFFVCFFNRKGKTELITSQCLATKQQQRVVFQTTTSLYWKVPQHSARAQIFIFHPGPRRSGLEQLIVWNKLPISRKELLSLIQKTQRPARTVTLCFWMGAERRQSRLTYPSHWYTIGWSLWYQCWSWFGSIAAYLGLSEYLSSQCGALFKLLYGHDVVINVYFYVFSRNAVWIDGGQTAALTWGRHWMVWTSIFYSP